MSDLGGGGGGGGGQTFRHLGTKQTLSRPSGGGVRILHPINRYGDTETGPRFKVSPKSLEKPRIKLTTPRLPGE